MLVLTRRIGERIVIDNDIVVEVLEVKGNRIRLGIQAPAGVAILRQELVPHEVEREGKTENFPIPHYEGSECRTLDSSLRHSLHS
ncbi:MAG TPA: carbon storage regulator [Gemmataceae bacterium]|nr:carbon storage regulator [Gemmataceae bacterium]